MNQNINTIQPLSSANSVPKEGAVRRLRVIEIDIPLMQQVVNDMEYNVGHRPTIPSCFEESSELGVVDKMADIRISHWDMLADECLFRPQPITPLKDDSEAEASTPEATTE